MFWDILRDGSYLVGVLVNVIGIIGGVLAFLQFCHYVYRECKKDREENNG